MDEKIVIKTSDFAVGQSPQVLTTAGVGSCVVICLYEQEKKIGSLSHIMLPNARGEKLNPLRFADTAMETVLLALEKRGVAKQNLSAKVIGGAHMFSAFDFTNDIGARNVAEVKKILITFGIVIKSEDTGGTFGRSVEFNLATSQVTISTKA